MIDKLIDVGSRNQLHKVVSQQRRKTDSRSPFNKNSRAVGRTQILLRANRNTIINLSFLTYYCTVSITIKQKAVPISHIKQTEAMIVKYRDYLQDKLAGSFTI